MTVFAQQGYGCCPIALGQPLAVWVKKKPVVRIVWGIEAEKNLDQAMNVRRIEQIHAAGHQGNVLKMIVVNHGEVITRWGVFAGQDQVAEPFRSRMNPPGMFIMPYKWTGLLTRPCHIESPGMRLATFNALGPLR